MAETVALVIVCTISFVFGMWTERNIQRRGNFRPVDNPNFEARWISEPPPFHIGGSVGERPPTVITHIYAPWRNQRDHD